jgi:hypothetical protein
MSKNINLVIYATDNNEKLYEKSSELIETAFISNDLLKEIEKDWPLIKKSVFELAGSEDHYLIECFDDSKIRDILGKLETLFVILLKNESEKILDLTDIVDSSQLPALPFDHNQTKNLEMSILRFRTITNVINIFKLKSNKYTNDASAVLKIG